MILNDIIFDQKKQVFIADELDCRRHFSLKNQALTTSIGAILFHPRDYRDYPMFILLWTDVAIWRDQYWPKILKNNLVHLVKILSLNLTEFFTGDLVNLTEFYHCCWLALRPTKNYNWRKSCTKLMENIIWFKRSSTPDSLHLRLFFDRPSNFSQNFVNIYMAHIFHNFNDQARY